MMSAQLTSDDDTSPYTPRLQPTEERSRSLTRKQCLRHAIYPRDSIVTLHK